MGHVGEELGLVLRGQRQLFRLLFHGHPRLIDLAVLLLDLHVLLHEQLRLFLELLVGLLQLFLLLLQALFRRLEGPRLFLKPGVRFSQLFLPGLQLHGERLRLLQQLLRPHCRGDGVEDDPDAFGELIQERKMDVAEPVEGGQLDHRLHLTLEEHGHDHDVERAGLAEA